MSKTFAKTSNDARLMLAGIKQNAESLKGIGIEEAHINEFEAAYKNALELDERQEQLKADLKKCTEQLCEATKNVESFISNSKKRVKLIIPQSGWKAFGISDKR